MSIDVLVVGAGPAGSIAALVLARAGLRVRLVDRASFPRDKLCGDTLNPGSLAILDRLGLGATVRRGALPITGMRVTGPGAQVSADYPEGLHGVSMTRRCLDHSLIEAAAAAGACVETGVGVSQPVMDDDGRVMGVRLGSRHQDAVLRSRVVVAADGRGSRLAARVKLSAYARSPRRWAFGAYFSNVSHMTNHGEMHIRRGGYVGVAPLPGGLTNVSVVRDEQRGHPIPPAHQQASVRVALEGDAELRARFARATQVSPVTVMGPLAVNARAAGTPGLVLAGDAAGFIDPMTGDGLRFAIRGGELAAEAVLEEFASGQPAYTHLEASRAREFTRKCRLNRALRVLVGSPRALDLAAAVSSVWTTPVAYLIQLAGDVPLARKGA